MPSNTNNSTNARTVQRAVDNLLLKEKPTTEDFRMYHYVNFWNTLDSKESAMSSKKVYEVFECYTHSRIARSFAKQILQRQYTRVYFNDATYLLNVCCGNSAVDDYPFHMDKFNEYHREILQNCNNFNKFFRKIAFVFGKYFVWLTHRAFFNDVATGVKDLPDNKPFQHSQKNLGRGEKLLKILMDKLAPIFLTSRSMDDVITEIELNEYYYRKTFVEPFFVSVLIDTIPSDGTTKFRSVDQVLTYATEANLPCRDTMDFDTGSICDDRLSTSLLVLAIAHELFRGDIKFYLNFVGLSKATNTRCGLTNYAMSPLTNFVDRMHFSHIPRMFLKFNATFSTAFGKASTLTRRILVIPTLPHTSNANDAESVLSPTSDNASDHNYSPLLDDCEENASPIKRLMLARRSLRQIHLEFEQIRTYLAHDPNRFSYPSLMATLERQREHDYEFATVDFYAKYPSRNSSLTDDEDLGDDCCDCCRCVPPLY